MLSQTLKKVKNFTFNLQNKIFYSQIFSIIFNLPRKKNARKTTKKFQIESFLLRSNKQHTYIDNKHCRNSTIYLSAFNNSQFDLQSLFDCVGVKYFLCAWLYHCVSFEKKNNNNVQFLSFFCVIDCNFFLPWCRIFLLYFFYFFLFPDHHRHCCLLLTLFCWKNETKNVEILLGNIFYIRTVKFGDLLLI